MRMGLVFEGVLMMYGGKLDGGAMDGGGYRNRTDMRLLSEVFETSASASSANPPISLLDHKEG